MNVMRIVAAMSIALAAAVCAYAAPTSGGKNDSSAVDDTNWRGGPTEDWFVNWDKALAESKKTNKKLFLLSTGSDWCGWCKKLRAEVLDKPEFIEFARKELILVYLDSPSRNPLGKEQKAHNRQIVKALPFGGGVPNVLVMNAKGEKLGAIGGGGLDLDEYLKKLRGILVSKGSKFNGAEARTLFNGGYKKLADWYAQQEAKRPPVSKHVPKGWTEDFEAARQQAAKEGKFVLLAFSGSDWCGPCMALEKEVLSQRKYMGRLTKKYVPVMMSVPRDNSTLSKLAASQNDVLKERYGIRAFPTIVVVNPLDGEEVKRHSGYRSNDPNGYLKQLDGMMKGVKWPKKAKEQGEAEKSGRQASTDSYRFEGGSDTFFFSWGVPMGGLLQKAQNIDPDAAMRLVEAKISANKKAISKIAAEMNKMLTAKTTSDAKRALGRFESEVRAYHNGYVSGYGEWPLKDWELAGEKESTARASVSALEDVVSKAESDAAKQVYAKRLAELKAQLENLKKRYEEMRDKAMKRNP